MSSGYTQLLTIIDRSSRWREAVPISSTTATTYASAFFHHWVSRFGVLAVITSDRGVQFTSSLWSSMCQLFAICHLQTPAYHPQANGAIERFHCRLKDALRACGAAADWYHHLPWVLLAIRTASRDEDSPTLLSCSTVRSWWFLASLSLLLRTRCRQTASYSSSALLWMPLRRLQSSTIVPLPPQLRIPFQWPCFMPAMCLCTGTPPSRRWPQPMTARTWCWSDLPTPSGSSSATRPMWSLLLASKLLSCRRTRLSPNPAARGGLPAVRLFFQLSTGPHRVQRSM
jgi:Integrase core domain